MSTFFELDCGGETATIEKTDDGDFIFHGWDEETELAAIELGFEPSACRVVWNAINEDMLNFALLYQARHGNPLIVEALLFVGASVDAKTGTDVTPLHGTAYHSHADIAKVLLEAGASVDAKDMDGWTPLHTAAFHGNIVIANALIKAGASVTVKDRGGWTPLHVAADCGCIDVVNALLEAGSSVGAKTDRSLTPLDTALEMNVWRSRNDVITILEDWAREHGE